MDFANKCLFLCFAWSFVSYSYELAEYCFTHSKNDYCLELLTLNSSAIAKIEQSDSLKCDGEFNFERQDIFNLSENIVAIYKTYDAEGCLGSGGSASCSLDGTNGSFNEFSTTKCLVKVKLDIPVTFPDKFSICKHGSFQIKDVFGKKFRAEWKARVKCSPYYDTTFAGSYFIRITGECD